MRSVLPMCFNWKPASLTMADVQATEENRHDSETGPEQPSIPEEGISAPDSSENTKELGSEGGKGEQRAEKEALNGENTNSSSPKENGENTSSSSPKENGDIVKGSEEATVTAQKQPAAPLPAPKPKYEWYQTQADVVINIMVKKLRAEDVHVQFAEESVSASIKLPSGDDYSLKLRLAHSVVPAKCRLKVLSTKVELKMRKAEGLHWSSLEQGVAPTGVIRPAAEGGKEWTHKYPSSSHYTRNWDKLVAEVKAEEKEEKPEGDAALNKLFQQIYHDGSDEVRKAMNKSFVESGGTVLSTNWKEVGEKTVERKPPDGMEWKKYEY